MSRRARWVSHVACMEQIGNSYNILIWEPQWKRVLGRSRRRWEDNIRINLRKKGCQNVDLDYVA
jgi:hypothetical protein